MTINVNKKQINKIVLIALLFCLSLTFIPSRSPVVATDYNPFSEVSGDQYLSGDFVSIREYKYMGQEISRDRHELTNTGGSLKTDIDLSTSLVRQKKIIDTFEPVIEDHGNYSVITYRKDYVFEADIQVITISNDNDIPYTSQSSTGAWLYVFYQVTDEYQADALAGGCDVVYEAEYGDYKDWTIVSSMSCTYKYIDMGAWRTQARNLGLTSNTPITFQISVNPAFSNFPTSKEISDVGSVTYIDGWAGVVSAWNTGYDGGLITGQGNLLSDPQEYIESESNEGYENGEIGNNLPIDSGGVIHSDVDDIVFEETFNDIGIKNSYTREETEGWDVQGEPENSALQLFTSSNQSVYQSSNYQFNEDIVDLDYSIVEFDYNVKKLKPKTLVNEIQYSGTSRDIYIRRTVAYWSGCFWELLGCERKVDQGAILELDNRVDVKTDYLPYNYKIYDVYLYDTINFRVPVFVRYKFTPDEAIPPEAFNPDLTTNDDSQDWELGVQTQLSGDTIWNDDVGVFGHSNASMYLDTSAGEDWDAPSLSDVLGGLFGSAQGIIISIIVIAIISIIVIVIIKRKKKKDIKYRVQKRVMA